MNRKEKDRENEKRKRMSKVKSERLMMSDRGRERKVLTRKNK